MNKTKKFEHIYFSLEPFLESLQDVHVNVLLKCVNKKIKILSNGHDAVVTVILTLANH